MVSVHYLTYKRGYAYEIFSNITADSILISKHLLTVLVFILLEMHFNTKRKSRIIIQKTKPKPWDFHFRSCAWRTLALVFLSLSTSVYIRRSCQDSITLRWKIPTKTEKCYFLVRQLAAGVSDLFPIYAYVCTSELEPVAKLGVRFINLWSIRGLRFRLHCIVHFDAGGLTRKGF